MKYNQILSKKKCKGKTIDRIVELRNWTYFIFTDNTYCIYNVHFHNTKLDIEAASGNWGLMKLGFISNEEYDKRELDEKLESEIRQKNHEIEWLKTLKAKYPDVV